MSQPQSNRPKSIGGIHLGQAYEWLDHQRNADVEGFETARRVQKEFGCSRKAARQILRAWQQDSGRVR